jgi:hypothetical protein
MRCLKLRWSSEAKAGSRHAQSRPPTPEQEEQLPPMTRANPRERLQQRPPPRKRHGPSLCCGCQSTATEGTETRRNRGILRHGCCRCCTCDAAEAAIVMTAIEADSTSKQHRLTSSQRSTTRASTRAVQARRIENRPKIFAAIAWAASQMV